MKRIVIIFSIIISGILNAQTSVYKPFPTSSGNWIYRLYDDFYQPTNIMSQVILYGDTLISGRTYKKIYTYEYSGALRDSSKIIYYVPKDSVSEIVMYDFNLAVGDTFTWPFANSWYVNDTIVVTSIDSVQSSVGYHKLFRFDSGITGVEWIEGIGNPLDILWPIAHPPGLSGYYKLECMQSDLPFIYPTSFAYCVVGIEETSNLKNVNIFPNPSTGSVTIKANSIAALSITNIVGQIFYNKHFSNQQQVEVSNLNSGIYIVTITNTEGFRITKKLIIE